MTEYPIYVASKGRPDAPTFDTLDNSSLDFKVLVEPQDADAYAEAIGDEDLIVLDENDRGLAYVRQCALDRARADGETALSWYWMLDDDIGDFYRTQPALARNVRIRARDALEEVETWVHKTDDGNLGIVALEYQQYAWNATPGRATWNSYTDVATLISPQVLANYRQELPLKVDRDFTLQVLAAGYDTARLRWLSFAVPTNGTNAGGLHDRYAEGIEETASRMMEQLWPGVCEAKTKPNGRPDVKIHWRRLRGGQLTT